MRGWRGQRWGRGRGLLTDAGSRDGTDNLKLNYKRVALGAYVSGMLREATHHDYDDAKRRLDAAGMAYEASEAPNGGIRQMFVTELNGVTIELNCRTPPPG